MLKNAFDFFAKRPAVSSVKLAFCAVATAGFALNEKMQDIRLETGVNLYAEHNIPYADALISHSTSFMIAFSTSIAATSYLKYRNTKVEETDYLDERVANAVIPALAFTIETFKEFAGWVSPFDCDGANQFTSYVCNSGFDTKDILAEGVGAVAAYAVNRL